MQVVNKRTYNGPGVYIGRPSKWGNPFTHLPYGKGLKVKTRSEAVKRFEVYAALKLRTDPLWLDGLLDAPALICWCAPLACHGDVLKRMIEHKFDR